MTNKKTCTIMLEISLPTNCGRLSCTIVRAEPGAYEPMVTTDIPADCDKIFIKLQFGGKLVFEVFRTTGEYIGGIVGSGNFAAAEDIGKVKVRRIMVGSDALSGKRNLLAGFYFSGPRKVVAI